MNWQGPEAILAELAGVGPQAIDETGFEQPFATTQRFDIVPAVASARSNAGEDVAPAEVVNNGGGDGRTAEEP